MITENVIAKLDEFVPSDDPEDVDRLYGIFDKLQALAPALRSPIIPTILGLIERYPEAELGSPGPLVHELEAIPGYEFHLRDSVARQPAYLSIWMVSRILNSELSLDERSVWLKVLRSVLTHPLASADLRQEASEFLEHQDQ